jgi:solute carrier family 25 iron transporter 28/37
MEDDDYESLPNSTVAVNMFAGAIAGITEHSVMFPMDSVKTRMQFSSIISIKTIRLQGLSSLWRGVNSVVVGAGPAHALSFATFEKCKLLFRDPHDTGHQVGADALSGAIATIVHDGVMTPFDVVKQRMQISNTSFYRGIWDCCVATFKAEGLKAFYISYPTTILMSIPFQSIHFASYEALKKSLNPSGSYDPKTHIISGGLAGAFASIMTQPMDVIKTLLQTRGLSKDSQVQSLHGFKEGCRMIYSRNGWKGFYRGCIPRVLYHMPSTAISWTTYEFMKMWFNGEACQ